MLSLERVSKTFYRGGPNERVALSGINLHLEPGEFVTIIGSNGAGKSTLLNAIAGVFPIDCGTIKVDGEDITRIPEHQRARQVGRVFQDPMMGTAGAMSIEENLSLALSRGQKRRLRRAIGRKERAFFREELAKLGLGLENRLTTKVAFLSGGQRQALTLLMATLSRPKLLLLDEHTAALDPRTAEKVVELTESIVGSARLTTLMVTHNMEQALGLGSRTIMMHEGRIVLDLSGRQRQRLTVSDLLGLFEKSAGDRIVSDRLLLAAPPTPAVTYTSGCESSTA